MDLQLTGKRALVTGSTAGIGLAIGTTLASEGATVIINGRSESRVAGAVAKIRQKYPQAKLEMLAGDLSKAEEVKQATSRFPHVDILINNLGIYEIKTFEDISDEDWMAMIETNFMSGVRLSRHYLSAEDESEELGTDRFHLERISHQYPCRDDSLWCDEDHA